MKISSDEIMLSPPTPPTPSADDPRGRLERILAGMERPVVALSGGVDSALLAARAVAAGHEPVALTLDGPLFAAEERRRARELARLLGLPLEIVPFDALAVPEIRDNPPDRCYYCKRAGFGLIVQWAVRHKRGPVLDGQNPDDENDYRPGTRAAAELGVRSPLKEAGLTKEMIRAWSRELDLPTAEVPAAACLASRIPHGTPIARTALERIDRAEEYLRGRGLGGRVRVREYDGLARIELEPADFAKLAAAAAAERGELVLRLRGLGYRHVTLDLAGYRPGGLDSTPIAGNP